MVNIYFFLIYFTAKVAEGNSLYSCGGEGVVLIHSIHDLQSKAKDMNAIIKKTNQLKVILRKETVKWSLSFVFTLADLYALLWWISTTVVVFLRTVVVFFACVIMLDVVGYCAYCGG